MFYSNIIVGICLSHFTYSHQ